MKTVRAVMMLLPIVLCIGAFSRVRQGKIDEAVQDVAAACGLVALTIMVDRTKEISR